jgi:hypothetical protein
MDGAAAPEHSVLAAFTIPEQLSQLVWPANGWNVPAGHSSLVSHISQAHW